MLLSPKVYLRKQPYSFSGLNFKLIKIMKVKCSRTLQEIFFFPILIVFTFSFFSFTTKCETLKDIENNSIMEQEITLVITKTTTLEELEKIKQQVVDQGLNVNFSDVAYNDKKEIIAITIRYKDANNNSGNYSVSSEKPINTIVIISDGNRISVKSEGSSNQAYISQENGPYISNNSQKSHADRQREMTEISEQMEREMEERMQEMRERHTAMETRMQKRRDSMVNQSQMRTNKSQDFKGNSHIITKNTTAIELLEIQKNYGLENIGFDYQNLQRNNKGEITQISITIDNRNGSISTSGFGNGSNAIDDITIAVDANHTIMKNVE